jgi:pyruvate/2-oxoacid:ferredoxin oxidoreductase beta subunit
MGWSDKMSKADRKIIKMDEILARDGKANVVFLNYDNEAFMNTGN